MEWIKEYADVILLCFTVIGGGFGGGFALFQWRKQVQTRRTDLAYKMMLDVRTNSQIRYLIEYGKFQYDGNFHGSALEPELDNFLSLLDHVCYLSSTQSLGEKEFNFFKDEINWVLGNREIQAYLWNLYHWHLQFQVPCSFLFLIKYGLSNRLFVENFESSKCNYFIERKMDTSNFPTAIQDTLSNAVEQQTKTS
jgi:hypothetical protein